MELCPKCADPYFYKGYCPRCGFDYDMLGTSTRCPNCDSSNWDDATGVCPDCLYDTINGPLADELISTEEVAESYEIMRQSDNVVVWNGLPVSRAFKPYVYTPYEPYFELVKKLKKWPFIRIHNTDHWMNKLLCRYIQWSTGIDVLTYCKAFGPFIFIPKHKEGTRDGFMALAHEGVHAKDFWKFGIIPFFVMQFLLPYGPSFRAWLEYRAYCEGMKAEYEAYGNITANDPDFIAEAMNKPVYNRCWPWPKLMKRWLTAEKDQIMSRS